MGMRTNNLLNFIHDLTLAAVAIRIFGAWGIDIYTAIRHVENLVAIDIMEEYAYNHDL